MGNTMIVFLFVAGSVLYQDYSKTTLALSVIPVSPQNVFWGLSFMF